MRFRLGGLLIAIAATSVALVWIWRLPTRVSLASVDLYFLFYPAYSRFGDELLSGRFPIWNPDLGMGIDELADSQFGFLYPPNLIFTILPAEIGIEVLTWSHIVLASFGALLLCRQAGISLAGGAIAAVAIASGSLVYYLSSWTTMLATFAWTPWIFLAARALAKRPEIGPALFLAVLLAVQILAGYLQFSLYTMALLPFFLWPSRLPVWVGFARTLLWGAAAVLMSVALAAVALLPSLAAIEGSWRDPENLPGWFYELLPFGFDTYRDGLAQSGLGESPIPYLGVVVTLLALGGVVARGQIGSLRIPAILVTGVALVLSLGSRTPLFPLLWELPFGNALTNPHKWVYFASLGAMLLAAVGADAFARGVSRSIGVLWIVLGFVLLAVVPFPLVSRLLGAVVLVVVAWRGRSLWVAWALPLLILANVLPGYVERPQRPIDNLDYFERYQDAYQYLRPRADDGRLFVLAPPLSYSPRQAEVERVPQITTNGTFLSMRLHDYMNATRIAVRDGEEEQAIALLRSLGARHVLTGRGDHAWLEDHGLFSAFSGREGRVWEDSLAMPRAYVAETIAVVPEANVLTRLGDAWDGGERLAVLESEGGPPGAGVIGAGHSARAEIVYDSPTEVRISVVTPNPAVVVLLDSWSSQWHAAVDGRGVSQRRANYVGRAVEVPAGEHVVSFHFRPTAFYAGLMISIVAALLGLFAYALDRRRRLRRVDDSESRPANS